MFRVTPHAECMRGDLKLQELFHQIAILREELGKRARQEL